MALSKLEIVRIEIADDSPGLYILADDTIEYYLAKNNQSIRRTVIDCCRTILFKLSQRGDETIDIFSLKGSRVADQYRQALQLFLRDSQLNPLLSSAVGYFGGISKSDMQANDAAIDNNIVAKPYEASQPSSNFFVYTP